ncbi:MAG: SPFH domain-containing protein [Clostridia bacterium]|jgi:membrane protease subunit (stomatin/prohibitin family)|nr:SPFH domain-containing protein [Clostridia bacterium]MBR3295910.1 SPFH domain-containing protein [Clostridia bacterium]
MGLLKAGIGSLSGVLADQWREYFYCESMSADTLVVKGSKRTSGRSSNTKASDNIISNGSIIAVNEGQCMMIVEQGKIVDVCAEPGEFLYDHSTEPSIFYGGLGQGILDTFKLIGKRFTFGGDTAKDQRVYYFNTKEIMGNKYGTSNPVPFRVVDRNIGLDIDISIRCNGEYSYKMTNPLLFYTNVCANVAESFKRSEIDSTLKSELLTALQPAFAKISEMGIRYSALPGHTTELADALNEVLSEKWSQLRGIEVASFGVNSVTASPEDEAMIKELQKNAVMRDPTMAAATIVGAQSDAMKAAASNSAGAMTGFMGLGMAQQAGGMDANALFQMGNQQKQQAQAAPAADSWTCDCGTVNTGKFCTNCGKPKPVPVQGWTCECGAVNKGKFCTNCGKPKPAGAPLYRCDKCGWEPEDPMNPPKFCPNCGDPFDDKDVK